MTDAEYATTSLASRLDGLTGSAERAVAEFLLRQGPRAAAMSAREIATAVGTSDATVVRTAKSLGYASLRELRHALTDRTEIMDLPSRLRATLDATTNAHDTLAHAVRTQLDALETLLRRVPETQFDQA